MRRLRSIIISVVVIAAVIVAGLMLVPSILGYERYAIDGGSMETAIPKGSVVYSQHAAAEDLAVSDVVTFTPPDPYDEDGVVTHRIRSIAAGVFTTKGDANEKPDPWKLTLDDGAALEKAHVPYLGYVYLALAQPWVWILLITVPALVVAVLTARSLWRETGTAAAVTMLVLGSGVALAYFSETRTTAQPISVAPFSSIPSDTSIVPSWDIDDRSGGGVTSIYAPAFADALFLKTSNAATGFAANRYVDVDFADFAPSGQTAESVSAAIDFADDNGDAKTTCMYMEARRASTGAVIGTYGSPTAPLGCQPDDIPFTVTQPLDVAGTDLANDLRLRIYFNSEGTNAIRLYRAVIRVVLLGRTWTLLPTTTDDALDTTPTGSVPWGDARVDATAYRNAANWGNAYDARKYVALKFPDTVPVGATIEDVQLENVWKTANGAQHCLIVETYVGGNLLSTHGTPGSPAMCTTSSTAWSTNALPLGEINTAQRANDLTVRLYGWGGNRIDFDRVALRLTWSLGTFGCVDPDTETIKATRDSWADQNAPASTNGALDKDLRVKTQDGSRNRRTYLYFPGSSLPNGCHVVNATLKLFQNATADAGLRTIDVYRAASSWTEPGLSWNTAPLTTGAAVGANNSLANDTTVTWDVTALVNAMSGTNNGFVLRDRAENGARALEQKFDSRENVNPPQLLVTLGDG